MGALSLLLAMPALAADLPPEWRYVQPLAIDQPGLIRLSLPPATLDAARPGLDDLRVLDPAGREVPFAAEHPAAGQVRTHPVRHFDARLVGSTTVLSLDTGVAQPIEAVSLATPAPAFLKAVTVEGSTDQRDWQPLVSGRPIFRQGGAAELRVGFAPGVWPFLRVTIDDRRAEPVAFTGAQVHATTGTPAPAEPVTATVRERVEEEGQTRLTLDLGARQLALATLTLDVADPLFTRAVRLAVPEIVGDTVTERVLAQGTVFRVDVPGFAVAESVTVPLEVLVPGREAVLLIDNGDNPPLQVRAVRVTRRPVRVVFLAQQAGAYQVLSGNPRVAAPQYDVAALAGRLKDATAAAPVLMALSANPNYHPAEPLPEIEALGTPLDVTGWAWRKRVPITRAGVQQLELDGDVLARDDSSLRDLRLVRDGQQRPYLVERTSLSRRLVPVATAAPDPKRPTVSRWRLKLPHHNLPLTRLSCTTTTALFQREVRLSEDTTTDRGEPQQRFLGEATWTRTPPASKAALTLALHTPPVTDTLVLETDNGDNPAIELAGFAVYHPVTRLLFKAPADPTTWLYYGNRDAHPPRYDLGLIAPQLVGAEKVAAELATEESLRGGSAGQFWVLAGTRSVLFWGVLGLVVVVLLVVIVRLLPKPPTPTE